jgi:hypothetical protein
MTFRNNFLKIAVMVGVRGVPRTLRFCHIGESGGLRRFDFTGGIVEGPGERGFYEGKDKRQRRERMQWQRQFQISDLKFQIRETAKTTATADANADPSP